MSMCMVHVAACTSACSAHRFEQEFLNTVFRELEEQLAIARTEREETQSRAERERRASLKRARELEEVIPAHPTAATPPYYRPNPAAPHPAAPSPSHTARPLSLRRCERRTGRLSRCARSATRRRCAP